MRKPCIACCSAVLLLALGPAAVADPKGAPQPIETQHFATLPDGIRFPEGITANPATGDVFVSTFDFGPNPNKLVRFSRNGHVAAVKDFDGTPLLGLGFAGGKVWILNFGASQVQRIAPSFGAATPVESVATLPPLGPAPPRTVGNPDGSVDTIAFGANFPAPNALVFDSAGTLYVSDSFKGAIYKLPNAVNCMAPCGEMTLLKQDPLLATAGFPPFGANGLALSADEKTLFVANTGDNRVLAVDLAAAGNPVSVFAESLHGADGLLFESGRLWVAANQADSVFAINAQGRPIYRAGEFEAIDRDGTPRGLLFPASLVIVDGWMYVANLALPLTDKVGDEPEEDVRRWTVSRFRVPR